MLTTEAVAEVWRAGQFAASTLLVSGTGAAQRDFAPFQARLAHVDAEREFAFAAAFENAGARLEPQDAPVAAAHQPIGDAARAVAAGAGFAAVVVVDAHIAVRIGPARVGQRHQLIESEPLHAMDGANLIGGQRDIGAAQVEDDDLIARAVHFGDRATGRGGYGLGNPGFSCDPDGLAPPPALSITRAPRRTSASRSASASTGAA